VSKIHDKDLSINLFCHSVIQKGQIMESGTHIELMQRKGEYANFWNLQAQDFI